MPDVRRTSVQVGNPSRLSQRMQAAQRQADSEVADDEEAVNVRVAWSGSTLGEEYTLWWPVTYEVRPAST